MMKTMSAQDLTALLGSHAGGETLRLPPGEYPKVAPKTSVLKREQPLIIEPADPASPPRFTQTLNMAGWSNVILKGCDFDISMTETTGAPAISISGGEKLSILGGRVTGRETPNDRWGYGIKAKEIVGFTVKGVKFSTLRRCIGLGGSDNVEIVDNDFSNIGTDGIDLSGIVRGLVARNLLTDFHPIGKDHPDAIQIMQVTAQGHRGCNQLRILDNLVLCGHVGRVRAQGTFGTGDTHEDIEIGRNLYIDTNWNGIKLSDMKDLNVHDNTVLFVPEVPRRDKAATKSWIGFERCTGRASGNRAMKISLEGLRDEGKNVEIAAATESEVEKAVSGWMAKFRAKPPATTPAHPGRRAAFEAWDQAILDATRTQAFLRSTEA